MHKANNKNKAINSEIEQYNKYTRLNFVFATVCFDLKRMASVEFICYKGSRYVQLR